MERAFTKYSSNQDMGTSSELFCAENKTCIKQQVFISQDMLQTDASEYAIPPLVESSMVLLAVLLCHIDDPMTRVGMFMISEK